MSSLADRAICDDCRGTPPLESREVREHLQELAEGWRVVDDRKLVRRFVVSDFAAALALANRIGVLADAAGHHPDLGVRYGALEVVLWTHTVDRLTENDFILAARIDRLA